MIFNPFEAFSSKKKKPEQTPDSERKLSLEKFRNKSVLTAFLIAQSIGTFAQIGQKKTDAVELPSKLNISMESQKSASTPESSINYNDYLSFEPEAFTHANFEKNTEGFSVDMEQSFETDKAEINGEAQEVIRKNIQDFFTSITPETVDMMLKGSWEFYGSSDERPTNAWGEKGNKALTQARVDALQVIFDEEMKSFDFAENGLSDDDIERIRHKEIKQSMPENGVTLVTDFINPETGKNFTSADVEYLAQQNPDKLAYLLQQARRVEFRTDIPLMENTQNDQVESTQEKQEKDPTYEYQRLTQTEVFKDINNYDSFAFGLDNSPSASYEEMVAGLEKYMTESGNDLFGKLQEVAVYSDNIHDSRSVQNLNQLSRFVGRHLDKGSHRERVITSAMQMLEKYEAQKSGNHALIMWTDEMIQDGAMIPQLDALAQEKGYEVLFAMTNDRTQEVGLVPLSTLVEVYNNNQEHLYMADGSGRHIAGKNLFIGVADIVYDRPDGFAHSVVINQNIESYDDGQSPDTQTPLISKK